MQIFKESKYCTCYFLYKKPLISRWILGVIDVKKCIAMNTPFQFYFYYKAVANQLFGILHTDT